VRSCCYLGEQSACFTPSHQSLVGGTFDRFYESFGHHRSDRIADCRGNREGRDSIVLGEPCGIGSGVDELNVIGEVAPYAVYRP
jgi:hypothetical protein